MKDFFGKLKDVYRVLFDKKALIKFSYPEYDKSISEEENFINLYATLETKWSFPAMMEAYKQLKEKFPKYKPLLVYEDPAQCQYTAMHASGDLFLETDAEENEDEDYSAYKDYKIILKSLKNPANKVELKNIKASIDLDDEDEAKSFKKICSNPIIFEEIEVYLCPTNDSTDCFARFPNGYFEGYLQPHESYALICHLSNKYGYEFVGLGADTFLFAREKTLKMEQAKELQEELAQIYNIPFEKMKKILEFLPVLKHLCLPYGETLQDLDS